MMVKRVMNRLMTSTIDLQQVKIIRTNMPELEDDEIEFGGGISLQVGSQDDTLVLVREVNGQLYLKPLTMIDLVSELEKALILN